MTQGGGKIKPSEVVKDWALTPPTIFFRLQNALANPNTSFKEFSVIIEKDPALTVRLLKIVNSPMYGFSEEVQTIEHALNIIGTEQLSELALATSVARQFTGIPRGLVDMDSFWRHAMGCGLAARFIAQQRKQENLESYYTAGMLQNMGSLILFQKFPQQCVEIMRRCRETKEQIFDVEREILGASHAKLGGTLLKKWNLPGRLVEPVLYHHRPALAKEYPIATAIVHVADIMVCELKLGFTGDTAVSGPSEYAMKILGFTEWPMKELEEQIKDKFYDLIFFSKDSMIY
ncbi:MAG: phosphohydrolase [Nitrospinae bacterium CG11_big_fil_rev_8_21_14_0_20_56_8]|nr:MAG: phosphohydrolase [Nitrospinae bacterium CG11_big_fil_rev_8_21_14_0_20_56_8]